MMLMLMVLTASRVRYTIPRRAILGRSFREPLGREINNDEATIYTSQLIYSSECVLQSHHFSLGTHNMCVVVVGRCE